MIDGIQVPLYIVADPAYPLLPWVQKAYQHNPQLTRNQKRFNTCLSKARFVVEHAFGRLKGRWRCLLKRNYTTLAYIIMQISACCVLHNLCEMQQEEFLEEWRLPPNDNDDDDDDDDDNDDVQPGEGGEQPAANIRNALMNSVS